MGCLVAILALVSPRLLLVILWLFTNLIDRAFDSVVLPILGFVLAPFMTAVYVLAYEPRTGMSTFGWILVGIALFLDLGAYGGARRGMSR